MSRGSARSGALPWLVGGALLSGAVVAALRSLDVVMVRGRSMAPALEPGDRQRELIKRVTRVERGAVTLRGDAPHASTDSRAFGTLPVAAIRWRAVLRYWPLARFGTIPALPARPLLGALEEGGEPACSVPEALIAGL